MTPDEISKLSNQQLNELIAVKRGWKHPISISVSGKIDDPNKWWMNPDVKEGWSSDEWACTRVPNFCSDWQYAGELFVELVDKSDSAQLCGEKFINDELAEYWVNIVTRDGDEISTKSNNYPTRAIAEAWYLMELNK